MVAQAESKSFPDYDAAIDAEPSVKGKFTFILPRRESQSRICKANAAIAQLVEHDLAKVGVASSSRVCRSKVDL